MATTFGYVLENAQRFGFDRIEWDDYGNTVIVSAYGQSMSLNSRDFMNPSRMRQTLDQALKLIQERALDGLRNQRQRDQEYQPLDGFVNIGDITCQMPVRPMDRMDNSMDYLSFGCASTMMGMESVGFMDGMSNSYHFEAPLSDEERKAQKKKHRKAENKAVLLMQNMIGSEQCDVYRKFHRVIVKPNKRFWVIGNISNSFHKDLPFSGKPDVVRIDNAKKLHITWFCVDQNGGGKTPYTDKVITFASHLMNDEEAFVKTVNRVSEDTLDKMYECAKWGV